MMSYQVLADFVVLLHAMYVAFVVFGFVAILAGTALGWRWVRNIWFRSIHLAAILAVVLEAIIGVICPLTSLEQMLRRNGGERSYPGSILGHWAHALIFYDAPLWVFTVLYIAFGICVCAVFIYAPPERARCSGRRRVSAS